MPLAEAVVAHAGHRAAWYQDFIGPLLIPVTAVDDVIALTDPATRPTVGVIGELSALARFLRREVDLSVRQVEGPVAKRGEDPRPGVDTLVAMASDHPAVDVYAEIPLTWGLHEALDQVAEARARGVRIGPKFRTGGLAAELFPTPAELAAVISACRDRELPFKLTAGLHHAIRHGDADTGFVHHGFLNVLAATLTAVAGGDVARVTERLGSTDPIALIEVVRAARSQDRPLWIGFGSCSVREPLADLVGLRLVAAEVSS